MIADESRSSVPKTEKKPMLDEAALSQQAAAAAEHHHTQEEALSSGGGTNDASLDGVTTTASYVQDHNIHLLLDSMVKDILSDKPQDSTSWMMRWFLEKHRVQCEERHLQTSPQHRPARASSELTTPSSEALLPPMQPMLTTSLDDDEDLDDGDAEAFHNTTQKQRHRY